MLFNTTFSRHAELVSASILGKLSINVEIYDVVRYKKAALNRIAYGKNTQPPSVWTGLSYQSMLPNNSIPSKKNIVKRFGLN